MAAKEELVKRIAMLMFAILLAVSVVFVVQAYLGGHFQSVESLRAYVAEFGTLGPLVLILIQALQVVIPVLPGFFGSIVGTGLFGSWGSFWCNYIGISAGSIIAFLLAKWLGNNILRVMFPKGKYESYIQWIRKKRSYTWLLFWSILLPLAPDDFLCYFSGLSNMDTRKFVWIIVLAKPWCILFYSFFFDYFI